MWARLADASVERGPSAQVALCEKVIAKLTEEFEKDDVDKGYSTWHCIKRALREREATQDAPLSRWEVPQEDFIKHNLGGSILPEKVPPIFSWIT